MIKTILNTKNQIFKYMQSSYPHSKFYDLDGREKHFVCEIEPVDKHPEFDTAVEFIIESKPHKHLVMTQRYYIIQGKLQLFIDGKSINLKKGDRITIQKGQTHWAKSKNGCFVEIFSSPGWTKKDHIVVGEN